MKIHHTMAHAESIAKTELECDNCGNIYEKYDSEANRYQHSYCSNECQYEHRSETFSGEQNPLWQADLLNESECVICGTEFEYNPNHKQGKYCSIECVGVGNSGLNYETVECGWCGEELERWPCHIKENNFCSYDCQGEWRSENKTGENNPCWEGGSVGYYGENWREQRRKARERDKYLCQSCGRDECDFDREHHVHHIRPIKEFKQEYEAPMWWLLANDLNNLVTMCHACHSRWEGVPLKPIVSD